MSQASRQCGQGPYGTVDGGVPQIEPRRENNPHAKIWRQIQNAIFWAPGVVVHTNRLATRIAVRQGSSEAWAVERRNPGVRCELTEPHPIAAVWPAGDLVAVCHDRFDRGTPLATAKAHHSGVNDLSLHGRPSPSEQPPADLDNGVTRSQSGHGENSEVGEWQCKTRGAEGASNYRHRFRRKAEIGENVRAPQ